MTTFDSSYSLYMLPDMKEIEWGIWQGNGTYYKERPPYNTKTDSITFSPAELQYIMAAMHMQSHAEWDVGNTLESCIFLPKLYLDSIAAADKERKPPPFVQRFDTVLIEDPISNKLVKKVMKNDSESYYANFETRMNRPGREESFYEHFSSDRLSSGRLWQISHPVFLRHNTVCIFYYCYEHAYGGASFMGIYVKTEKGWEEFANLHWLIAG